MSLYALSWSFDQKVKSQSAKLVLLALCDGVGTGNTVFASLPVLTRKTSMSRVKVLQGLRYLERRGFILSGGRDAVRMCRVYMVNDGKEAA